MKEKLKLVQVKFHAGSKNIAAYWSFKFASLIGDTEMTMTGSSSNDYNFDDYLEMDYDITVRPRQATLDALKTK